MNKIQISNIDIREEVKANNIFLWQIAAKLGVAESTFLRWLRAELSDELKAQIRDAIAEIKEAQ
jgi:hypothetical protein